MGHYKGRDNLKRKRRKVLSERRRFIWVLEKMRRANAQIRRHGMLPHYYDKIASWWGAHE